MSTTERKTKRGGKEREERGGEEKRKEKIPGPDGVAAEFKHRRQLTNQGPSMQVLQASITMISKPNRDSPKKKTTGQYSR
jgi:hypothetical protein